MNSSWFAIIVVDPGGRGDRSGSGGLIGPLQTADAPADPEPPRPLRGSRIAVRPAHARYLLTLVNAPDLG
jgi:hypothetical protein